MSGDIEKRNRLVAVIRSPTPKMQEVLTQRKKEGIEGRERRDFVWHYLVQSLSTMGNSRGWQGLILDVENYQQATYERLLQFGPRQRLVADLEVMGDVSQNFEAAERTK